MACLGCEVRDGDLYALRARYEDLAENLPALERCRKAAQAALPVIAPMRHSRATTRGEHWFCGRCFRWGMTMEGIEHGKECEYENLRLALAEAGEGRAG